MESDLFESDHEDFRSVVRGFVERDVAPNIAAWEDRHLIDRDVWYKAAEQGLLGLAVPEEYGGMGITDYRFRTIVQLELARVGASSLQSGFSVNDDIVLSYLLRHANDEQKSRWLPGFTTGETIGAIAMTEPDAGSDLRGIRTKAEKVDGGWRLSGSKTFITSGILADLVIVFARTGDAFSLFVVRDGAEGFSRGRKLEKVGLHAQDTAELFFDDVFVPDADLLGEVGQGLRYLKSSLPLERLGIAIAAQGSAEAALSWTIDYITTRKAFGARIADQQVVAHRIAQLRTAVEVSRAYVDNCVRAWNAGTLTAVDAAKAKAWVSDLQNEVIDAGVQFHGGYGYMIEYPIARAFIDARVQRIYGGANEVMWEIVQKDLLREPR